MSSVGPPGVKVKGVSFLRYVDPFKAASRSPTGYLTTIIKSFPITLPCIFHLSVSFLRVKYLVFTPWVDEAKGAPTDLMTWNNLTYFSRMYSRGKQSLTRPC